MTFGTEGVKHSYIALGSSQVKAKYFLEATTSSTVLTQVSGQTSAMVSLDTDTLIATRQGAAWKIRGWPENIAIHHAKGCACCHEYINHLLGAQSLKSIYSVSMSRRLYRAPGLHVGAHMLICIYAQSQSKYISVFSSILFWYYFHFTVHTPFQFFLKFSLFFLPFYSLQKPVILTWHC